MRILVCVLLLSSTWHAGASELSREAQAAVLLYRVTERLNHLGLLMFIKAESDPVGRVAEQLTEQVDRIRDDLTHFARARSLSLEASILPQAELDARDIGQKRARRELLSSSGAEFCRAFAKAQFLAVSQMTNLTRVLADAVGDESEADRWKSHAEALAAIGSEVDRIWIEVCPTRH